MEKRHKKSNHKLLGALVVITAVLLFGAVAGAQNAAAAEADGASESVAARDARMTWWREARFGMFIHFGLYSIPGRGEWVQWNEQIPVGEYAKLADQFTLTNFDANAWVEAAKSAGMKYTVLTARHHDGFCLFDDPGNNFTTVNTAAHRDVVKEYVGAVRQAGLHVGLYYSPLDWRFPGFVMPDLQRQNAEAMRDQYHRQMKELLSNYGKVDVVWFDGGEQDWLNFGSDWKGGGDRVKRPTDKHYLGGFSWQHDRVYTMLRELQPNVIINGRADMPADFHSREGDGALGDFDNQQPWELCTTLAGTWGYQPNQKPKSLKDCIQLLAKVAGRDGNLLLNVGPAPDGKIDPAQVARLREIGDWLGRYGASIYGTRGGPFLPGDYGTATFRDKTIYLHIINWPGEKLTMPAIAAKVVRATAMTGGTVTVFQSDHNLELSMTLVSRSDMDTVIVLELDRPANALTPLEVKLASNSSGSR
jgi:alpha-L-fucosidase